MRGQQAVPQAPPGLPNNPLVVLDVVDLVVEAIQIGPQALVVPPGAVVVPGAGVPQTGDVVGGERLARVVKEGVANAANML